MGAIAGENKINTVVFDLGNVLVKFGWEEAFHEYFGWYGETFERVANATTRHEDWNRHDKGDLSEEEMLKRFISNDPSVEKEIRELYNHLDVLVTPLDYAHDWVSGLKKAGYKVYILSNYSRKTFNLGIKNGKLSIVTEADGAVISYQEQLIKPDPAIYECLFDRYDITPSEAVFIDDRADNVATGIRCGMHGIIFKTKEQVLKELGELGVKF